MAFWRWELIKETGWTIEQVNALKVSDFREWLQVRDGLSKARASLLNQPKGR